jgi:hypothetical protein
MRLTEALELKKRLSQKNPRFNYVVMRSGKRSLGVTPFYVGRTRQNKMTEIIEGLKSPRGGWTREALASIGVPWPPPKGWKKKLEALDDDQLQTQALPNEQLTLT